MTSWTERMHRRAATFGTVVTSCGQQNVPYPRRLEKVKFGFPLDVVCKNGIPGPLLVLILKLNKEAPFRKDVFRTPGHQGNIKKLAHFLQAGRLVNLDNFSIHTIASVLKKFLRKIPGGIFGASNEELLFNIINDCDVERQRHHIHSLITSLPVYTQQMLVVLFGTFRVVASNADRVRSGMTSEALGVSVAPSFFHSCVTEGREARHEDVLRFKVAMRVMKFLIDNFGVSNLFGRDNYEFYARITGRILKVEEDWIFSFRYPPDSVISPLSSQEEYQSTPALLQLMASSPAVPASSSAAISAVQSPSTSQQPVSSALPLDGASAMCMRRHQSASSAPARTLRGAASGEGGVTAGDVRSRLSVSLENGGMFKVPSISNSTTSSCVQLQLTMDELRDINMYAESTKSLSFLPLVHERQTERMRTRSEWFLTSSQLSRRAAAAAVALAAAAAVSTAAISSVSSPTAAGCFSAGLAGTSVLRGESLANTPTAISVNALDRCDSFNNKKLLRRSSSKKNKENGASLKHPSASIVAITGSTTPATVSLAPSISFSTATSLAPSISQTSAAQLMRYETGSSGGVSSGVVVEEVEAMGMPVVTTSGGGGDYGSGVSSTSVVVSSSGGGVIGGLVGRRAVSERDCSESGAHKSQVAYKPRI